MIGIAFMGILVGWEEVGRFLDLVEAAVLGIAELCFIFAY